jgi:hypothetical protein
MKRPKVADMSPDEHARWTLLRCRRESAAFALLRAKRYVLKLRQRTVTSKLLSN